MQPTDGTTTQDTAPGKADTAAPGTSREQASIPQREAPGLGLLTGENLAFAAMLAGVALITIAFRSKWLMGRKVAKTARPGTIPPDQDALALKQDLEELGARLASELDARATRLERLIADAERATAALEAAERRAASAPQRPVVEVKPIRPEAIPGDSLHQQVADLAEAGLSPVEIAQRVGRPTGQIELILNLRRGGHRS